MSHDYDDPGRRWRYDREATDHGSEPVGNWPGRRARTDALHPRPVVNNGGGQPLPASLAGRLGAELGADLSSVRLHTGADSADSAAALGANAYAVGQHVHFGAGKYDPSSAAGQHLIAHEVAHTVQQGPISTPQFDLEVSQPGDAHEVEADRFADSFVSGRGTPVSPVGRATVSRAIIQKQDAGPPGRAPAGGAQQPDATPSGAELTRRKKHAQELLTRYDHQVQDYIRGYHQWLAHNWIQYYGFTQQNPRLGWAAESEASALLSSTIQSAITGPIADELFDDGMKKVGAVGAELIGAAIGTELAPGIGTAIGFVLGVLIEQGASMLYELVTGKSDTGEAAAAAGRRTARLIDLEMSGFDGVADQAVKEHRRTLTYKQEELTVATSPQQVASILDWTRQQLRGVPQKKNPFDDSLFHQLLRQWVLEHAEDEEDANEETAEEDWEQACAEVSPESRRDLNNHPEIFAYQTRAHWQKRGLGTAQIEPIVRRADQIFRATEQGKIEDGAEVAMNEFDGRTFQFAQVADVGAFVEMVDQHLPRRYLCLEDDGRAAIANNQVKVECTFGLDTADGACYVDRWTYRITFPLGVRGVRHPRHGGDDPQNQTVISNLCVEP